MGKQFPLVLGTPPKPDLERATMRGDGGPDIVARQRLGHVPEFVENTNRAIGRDVADEVHATGSNRQRVGELASQAGGEPGAPLGALLLSRGCALERGRSVVLHIPLHKVGAPPTHLAKAAKAMTFPKSWTAPQAAQELDLGAALGLTEGQKDQLDPHIKTQARKLPKPPWHFVAATEKGIVVELQKARNAPSLPSVQDMELCRRQRLGARQGLIHRARTQIER